MGLSGCFGTEAVVTGLSGESQGNGVQKPNTPNVYYYPICSGLAFRGESLTLLFDSLHVVPPMCLPPHTCVLKTLKTE